MFFLKHTAKESQKISKTDAKKLRQDVLSLVSDSFEPLVDFILGKKSAVERLRWGFGSGGLANIFLVDEIPYFISLDGFVNTDEKFNFMKGTIRKIVPTVFFFLKARQFFNGDAVKQRELTQNVSHFVETFEMTSKFILSGAHLMTPGIIRMELRENSLKEASLALVHSRGNCVPYAVGFVSDSLAGGSPSGVGVYIVHSFGDALWTMYHEVFVAKSAGFPDCVPKEFCSGIVREVTIDLDCEPKADALPIPIESNDEQEVLPNGEDSQANWCSLFVGDDAILDFCLCESLQVISRTMLPFPVNQFTAVFLTCYPRGCGILKPQFKDTAYKHAVAFYRARPDTIVMDEKEKGVFVITSFNKWSKLMAEHKRQYESFLSDVHRPALHREAQDAEAAMLRDSRIVFNQSIASISLSFRPKRSIPIPMAKILLGGLCGRSSSTCQYPSLQDLEMGKCEQETVEAEDPFDYTLLDDLYSRKHIMDNLKEYIRNNSLMVVEVENKGLPTIQLDEALMTLQKGIVEDSLPLNVVEERALNQFSTMHEICVQFSIAGSSLTSGAIPPKYMLKSGNLPIVNIWTEKRAGNKVITIAKGLEALGFDLSLLSKAWQHLFSTSCSVFDPSVDMKNLKSGTKIPLEVHLQGNHAAKLQSVLSQDLSIPRNLVVSKKG